MPVQMLWGMPFILEICMPRLPHHASTLAATLLLTLAGGAGALAQDEQAQPAEPAQPSQPELPWVVGEDMQTKWELKDPALREVMDRLIGSFKAEETSHTPSGVHFHAAPVSIEGLDNAVFFEIHRADDVANSFQFGILHAYRNEGEPRLRFFQFANPDQGRALSGLWLAPYAFPVLSVDDLRPVMDIGLDEQDWSGATPHPYPTMREGAVELTSQFNLTDNGFELADRGYDASGAQVWGVPEGQTLRFTRFEPEPTVRTTESGLIIIDLIDPEGDEGLEAGGEIAVHYSGYLLDGKRFDSSRTPERSAFRVRIPGNLIQGWNEGLIGLEVGGRRRLIIPAHLGYGPRAVGGGLIPANSVLIFDVEGMWLQNPEPAPESAPAGDGHEGHDHSHGDHDHDHEGHDHD